MLEKIFIKRGQELADSTDFATEWFDTTAHNFARFAFQLHAVTSGSVQFSVQTRAGEGAEPVTLFTTSARGTVGTDHDVLNPFIAETDIFGEVRVKLLAASGSGAGLDISAVAVFK